MRLPRMIEFAALLLITAAQLSPVLADEIPRQGDAIYEVSTEECRCGPEGEGGTGTGKFIGGTGKYVGIRGSFNIERKVGQRDYDSRSWTDHVVVTGEWTLP